jgi:hypothetical protein
MSLSLGLGDRERAAAAARVVVSSLRLDRRALLRYGGWCGSALALEALLPAWARSATHGYRVATARGDGDRTHGRQHTLPASTDATGTRSP